MQFTVYILGGCCLWIALLGKFGARTQHCGRRWIPGTLPTDYQHRKTEAPPNSWPWHVGVTSSAFGRVPFGGGTLIAPTWVLTCAHVIVYALQCNVVPYGHLFSYHNVTGYQMAVTVADHAWRSDTRPSYNLLVDGVIIHPSYDQTPHGFDVALLKLNREVRRSKWTEYACLPEPGLDLPVGDFCYFAGWGITPDQVGLPMPAPQETLMELRIPIARASECQQKFPYMNALEQVCTDGAYGTTCFGDSGGGLHCPTENGSKWVVYGVSTFGDATCSGSFNGFSLTAPILDWIEHVIATYS